ncbi:hypothetical protein DEU56DRAFT_758090 [Suillus clintonianus]|uniref:uncharacterized protein n=1 Tax=Suillus clintonianus TaxID=1904413 RepID=UPI001B873C32|nr:uncharacterized protein DEU56DRAFT_758090 [Suillus clintonianus]KAG2129589.1 hypothetical protein DEU56DRAFT_758090 [Suillus clintonianus]
MPGSEISDTESVCYWSECGYPCAAQWGISGARDCELYTGATSIQYECCRTRTERTIGVKKFCPQLERDSRRMSMVASLVALLSNISMIAGIKTLLPLSLASAEDARIHESVYRVDFEVGMGFPSFEFVPGLPEATPTTPPAPRRDWHVVDSSSSEVNLSPATVGFARVMISTRIQAGDLLGSLIISHRCLTDEVGSVASVDPHSTRACISAFCVVLCSVTATSRIQN